MRSDARYLLNMDDETVLDMATGETAPVAAWVGLDGEDCDKADATVIVAGPFSDGWLHIAMSDTDDVVMH